MDVTKYLKQAVALGASDLFVAAGGPVSVKLGGQLQSLGGDKLRPEDSRELISQVYALAGRDMARYEAAGDDDFSFPVSGLARFRVSAYRQRASLAAVIRVVSFSIPDWKSLGIPEEVMGLSRVKSGLILVTGTAGSGKSTTQACIIDRINHERACHIVTLEDPVEFLHRNDKSMVSQREIAIDTENYLTGLRACLRQAPDVILLGEMRDDKTIQTAMTAAETGHTVIATLHTRGAANSIDRIIDVFPAQQQSQIRIQLAGVLHSVVSQQLLPSADGGRVPAFEILHANSAIRNRIREGKTHQMGAALASAGEQGMQTMDGAVLQLYRAGKITLETALAAADDPERLRRVLELGEGK